MSLQLRCKCIAAMASLPILFYVLVGNVTTAALANRLNRPNILGISVGMTKSQVLRLYPHFSLEYEKRPRGLWNVRFDRLEKVDFVSGYQLRDGQEVIAQKEDPCARLGSMPPPVVTDVRESSDPSYNVYALGRGVFLIARFYSDAGIEGFALTSRHEALRSPRIFWNSL